MKNKAEAVYVHIPFCRSICSYCDFCKMHYNEEMVDSYLDALIKEISMNYQGEVVKSLYIGGGTPSCLPPRQLNRLFNFLEVIKKDENTEFTIECNIEDIEEEKLEIFKKYGINRLSIGIESFDKDNIEFLGRRQVTDIFIRFRKLREMGFNNINVDLIYGLPNTYLHYLNEDLDNLLMLDPEHISTYSLQIEKNTKLHIDGVQRIDEEVDNDMYNLIRKRLEGRGYNHYEISNFAKPGYQSVHNRNYWENGKYYGFGLGASSFIGETRMTNTRGINSYLAGKYLYEAELIDEKANRDYEFMLGLRLSSGINKKNFLKKFKINVTEVGNVAKLIEKGMLIEEKDRIYVPKDKWYILNEILIQLEDI